MENIFIDTLCKMASEKSNVGTAAKVGAGAAATIGTAGALTAYGADRAVNNARERYISSKIKGDKYNKAFLVDGGVKNPFAAAKRLSSHNAKTEALKRAYGAGGVVRKISKGGKIAAGLGAAGVLAAGARSLLSKKKED